MKTMGRTIGCREIQREIDEADQADPLSPVVNAHLRDCAGCEAYYNEQFKLRQIVFSLGTVAAPGDFDFRLRARLAAEKTGARNPFRTANLSLGFRSAAFAAVLLLIGSALVLLRLSPSAPFVADSPNQAKPEMVQTPNTVPMSAAGVKDQTPTAPVVASGPSTNQSGSADPRRSPKLKRDIRRSAGPGSTVVASARNPRMATKEMGSTQAKVVKANDMIAELGHSVFPIESSSQPVKVSLDNGHGSSKTISLPGVSFGSQRVLTQSAPPLLASARSW